MNEIIAAAKGYGGKGIAYAKLKKQWTNDVALHVRAARVHPVPRAYLRFIWHEANKRRDLDNVAAAKKFIIDGLVVAKVLEGDGWDHIVGWNDGFTVSGKPGVEVSLFTSPEVSSVHSVPF